MSTDRLRVNEIFHSIQGEGTRAGLPCTFVRLTGCHLRCTYCDTEYAFYEGEWLSLSQIMERVERFSCPTVEITGGEPLLQPAVYPLMEQLLARGMTVLLETSGGLSIARVDPRVIRIVDVKTPSSGEAQRNVWENISLLHPHDEMKFVVGTREDYEWSREVLRTRTLADRCVVLFSPVMPHPDAGMLRLAKGGLEPRTLVEWILEDRLPVRLGLQLHKYIWSPRTRGV